MAKQLLCTLGPSSLNDAVIARLDRLGVDIFRINLSHTPTDQIEPALKIIRGATQKPICLDSEGAQVRNAVMKDGRVRVESGTIVQLHSETRVGDALNIQLTPAYVVSHLKPGDLVSIDFDTVVLRVLENNRAQVISGGWVGSNKAVTVDRTIPLECMSSKDRAAVQIGRAYGVEYVALSFAGHRKDVEELRALIDPGVKIISKIESRAGIRNLDSILEATDAILIDRGDLSREKPLEQIPYLQKAIIARANAKGKPVYVATNLLESMVDRLVPTRAEVNDILNTLIDGADGLVLAAETAIGSHPAECVHMVRRLMRLHERTPQGSDLEALDRQVIWPQGHVEPHGGTLVHQVALDERPWEGPTLDVDETILLDARQLALGTYSPLTGFMNQAQLLSVLETNHLPDGTLWTLPICLQTAEELPHQKVGLRSRKDGQVYATLEVEEVFQADLERLLPLWFETADPAHPGVARVQKAGPRFVAGKVELIREFEDPLRAYTLSPLQCRHLFQTLGWTTVCGFHTRNVSHRGHEHLMRSVLERPDVDGLLIHPVVGPKKQLDYQPEIILQAFEWLARHQLPPGRTVVGAFSTYSRYAGPREAVFTAICRKNYGCSHFIVGRDHTGVGNYYAPDAALQLFATLGDLGMTIVPFEPVNYCPSCLTWGGDCSHEKQAISGTQVRDALRRGELPPAWMLRPEVGQLVLDELKAGHPVFVE